MATRRGMHQSANAEKAMTEIIGRGDKALCVYKMGEAKTKE